MVDKTTKILERIRQKPESTRWAMVAAITMVSSALLIVFWVWNLSNRFASLSAPAGENSSSGSAVLPSSFADSIKGLADSFKAIRSGEDPEKVAKELEAKAEAENKPVLKSPSVIGYILRGAGEVIRFNLATIGAAFGNLKQGRF